MRKCPRCQHEIKEDEKYCPHCGLDLQGKYRPRKIKNQKMRTFVSMIIFFSCMSIPILYGQFLTRVNETYKEINNQQMELKEFENRQATQILVSYTTLTDFQNKFSNVDDVVEKIHSYEKDLHQIVGHVFNKEYSIDVFDNFNVRYTLTYTTKITDDINLIVKRTFDRAELIDEEAMSFQKKNAQDFEGLLFNDDEIKAVKEYLGEDVVTYQLMDDFSKRKDEFEKKKEKLGHYGIGNYEKRSSFVVYREGKTYYSEMKNVQKMK